MSTSKRSRSRPGYYYQTETIVGKLHYTKQDVLKASDHWNSLKYLVQHNIIHIPDLDQSDHLINATPSSLSSMNIRCIECASIPIAKVRKRLLCYQHLAKECKIGTLPLHEIHIEDINSYKTIVVKVNQKEFFVVVVSKDFNLLDQHALQELIGTNKEVIAHEILSNKWVTHTHIIQPPPIDRLDILVYVMKQQQCI